MLYLMNKMKCIGIVLFILISLGCKAERAETKKNPGAEIVPAETSEKSDEQTLPKKEYGGLYSDADLDRILKQGKRDIDPVAYYYAGNRCADKGEYQEAAKLYAMAAGEFESSTYKYSKLRWDSKWEE